MTDSNRKRRVGVIFGGRSGEHEISLASARAVMAAMDTDRYDIIPIGITHEGHWLLEGDPLARLLTRTAGAERAERAQSTHELVPGMTGQRFPTVDIIFPVLHGPYGEDGTIQGLLELAGVPYVGCGVLASSLAMDKIVSKVVFQAHGLPVARFHPVNRRDWEERPAAVLAAIEAHLRFPMFVKPANLGSSVGVNKATHADELAAALTEAARYDHKLLVEEAVLHAREIECSVLGNADPSASVPGEIVPSNEFYDYAAKYIDGQSALYIPAAISPQMTARVRELAVTAFKAVDGAGLARVDFLLNSETGELFLSEVNTMPGFTAISMYPKLWEASGLSFTSLIDRLIELALERHTDRMRSQIAYDGPLPTV